MPILHQPRLWIVASLGCCLSKLLASARGDRLDDIGKQRINQESQRLIVHASECQEVNTNKRRIGFAMQGVADGASGGWKARPIGMTKGLSMPAGNHVTMENTSITSITCEGEGKRCSEVLAIMFTQHNTSNSAQKIFR